MYILHAPGMTVLATHHLFPGTPSHCNRIEHEFLALSMSAMIPNMSALFVPVTLLQLVVFIYIWEPLCNQEVALISTKQHNYLLFGVHKLAVP